MDERIPIGRFARLSGLSVGAEAAAREIDEAEERQIVEGDIATLPV